MSRCSKSKPRRVRVKQKDIYESLGRTGKSEMVRKKLLSIPHYQPLSAREIKEKIKDLTERKRLKDWFDDEEETGTDTVNVALQISTLPGGGATSTVSTTTVCCDHCSTACCKRRDFEQFCQWGMNCEVSLKVKNTILKWDESELVEPHLEDMFSYNPASAVSRPPGIVEIPLGKSKKFNELLDVIAFYNERHYFHAATRNSKTFVREALDALNIECPQIPWLFEDYSNRIKSLRSEGVPEEFSTPCALTHYVKHNLQSVCSNPLDTEYVYFMCCCCQVEKKQRGGPKEREIITELEHCLEDLDSPMTQIQDNLVFNQYWLQLGRLLQH